MHGEIAKRCYRFLVLKIMFIAEALSSLRNLQGYKFLGMFFVNHSSKKDVQNLDKYLYFLEEDTVCNLSFLLIYLLANYLLTSS